MSDLKASISAALLEKRPLTPSTCRTYTSLLASLYTKMAADGGVGFLDGHVKAILAHIAALPSAQTRKVILAALFVLTANDSYRTQMMVDVKIVNDHYRKQEVTPERQSKLISWERVNEIGAELQRVWQKDQTTVNWVNMLIAMTMTGILPGLPPRRLEWADVRIRGFDKKSLTDNYISGKSVMFNSYKTAASERKKGKLQPQVLPAELVRTIARWKKVHSGDYLLVNSRGEKFTASSLQKRVASLYNGCSVDLLRSIYISQLYGGLNTSLLEDTADKMGHSVNAAMQFYIKPDASKLDA